MQNILHPAKFSSKRFDWMVLAVLVIALPLITPFLHGGLPATADAEIHLHRIMSAALDIDSGTLWPRWTPYLHHGFGYPIHNFYPPGVHILGGLAYLITHLDPVLIHRLLQIGATLLYPLGAYFFARTFAGKGASLAAAAAYTYAPFRFDELWYQTNLSQFCAMALIPWLFTAIAQGAKTPTRRWALWIGALLGAIVVTHHVTGFLVAPFAGLYALLMAFGRESDDPESTWFRRALPSLIVTVGGLTLGVLLSAIFWLPALVEYQYVQLGGVQRGSFSASANLIPIADLLGGIAPIDQAAANPGRFFKPGLPQILVAALGLLALLPRARANRAMKLNAAAGAIAAALAIVMMSPITAILWDRLPIASLVVFPWRLLGIAALAAIPGAAVLAQIMPDRWRNAVAGGLVGVFFVAALPMLYAHLSFVEAPFPTPAAAIEFEKKGNLGLTSANEYLPIWAETAPLGGAGRVTDAFVWRVDVDTEALAAEATITPLADCDRGASCFQIAASDAFTLPFHQLYFPGWQVILDDQDAPIYPTDEFGLIAVDVPAGEHTLSIRYAGTDIQRIATLISLGVFMGMVGLWFVPRHRVEKTASVAENTPGDNALALRAILALSGFMLLHHTLLLPYTEVFRPRSDPENPPAQHALHTTFGDHLTLVGYDLDATTVAPGQTINVTLYWWADQPLEQVYRPVVQLINLPLTSAWAASEADAPGGVYTTAFTPDTYVIDAHPLTVFADSPPYVGHVAVQMIDAGTGDALPLADGADRLLLEPLIRITGQGSASVKQLDVVLGDTVELWCVSAQAEEDAYTVDLYWHVRQAPTSDFRVFLHGLDDSGEVVIQNDGQPLDGVYPPLDWLPGQTLHDRRILPSVDGLTSLALGLYDPASSVRLTATQDGAPVADDRIVLPLAENACTP